MNLTDDQRLGLMKLHYEAWATCAGYSSLEDALRSGKRTEHGGQPVVEGGILFCSGILLCVLDALVGPDDTDRIRRVGEALDNLPPDWSDLDGLNDGTYSRLGFGLPLVFG